MDRSLDSNTRQRRFKMAPGGEPAEPLVVLLPGCKENADKEGAGDG